MQADSPSLGAKITMMNHTIIHDDEECPIINNDYPELSFSTCYVMVICFVAVIALFKLGKFVWGLLKVGLEMLQYLSSIMVCWYAGLDFEHVQEQTRLYQEEEERTQQTYLGCSSQDTITECGGEDPDSYSGSANLSQNIPGQSQTVLHGQGQTCNFNWGSANNNPRRRQLCRIDWGNVTSRTRQQVVGATRTSSSTLTPPTVKPIVKKSAPMSNPLLPNNPRRQIVSAMGSPILIPPAVAHTINRPAPESNYRPHHDNDNEASGNNHKEYNIGYWSAEEHELFVDGLKKYGKDWRKIAVVVGTRSMKQVGTHATHYFQQLEKEQDRASSLLISSSAPHPSATTTAKTVMRTRNSSRNDKPSQKPPTVATFLPTRISKRGILKYNKIVPARKVQKKKYSFGMMSMVPTGVSRRGVFFYNVNPNDDSYGRPPPPPPLVLGGRQHRPGTMGRKIIGKKPTKSVRGKGVRREAMSLPTAIRPPTLKCAALTEPASQCVFMEEEASQVAVSREEMGHFASAEVFSQSVASREKSNTSIQKLRESVVSRDESDNDVSTEKSSPPAVSREESDQAVSNEESPPSTSKEKPSQSTTSVGEAFKFDIDTIKASRSDELTFSSLDTQSFGEGTYDTEPVEVVFEESTQISDEDSFTGNEASALHTPAPIGSTTVLSAETHPSEVRFAPSEVRRSLSYDDSETKRNQEGTYLTASAKSKHSTADGNGKATEEGLESGMPDNGSENAHHGESYSSAISLTSTLSGRGTESEEPVESEAANPTCDYEEQLLQTPSQTPSKRRRTARQCTPMKKLTYSHQKPASSSKRDATHKVCCILSDNVKQNILGSKIVAKMEEYFPSDVHVTSTWLSHEKYVNMGFGNLEQVLKQYHAIVILPGMDPDKRLELHDNYVRNYKELCQIIFRTRRCVPARAPTMNIFDKINVMALLDEAQIPLLPWRIIQRDAYEFGPYLVFDALTAFAAESPGDRLVFKTPYTTTSRTVSYLKKDRLMNLEQLQPFMDNIFKPGFNAIFVQHYTPFFKSNGEHRLYFVHGKFVAASGTLQSADWPIFKEDIPEEISVAADIFTKLPWLKTFPHLRIDFGRCSKGRLFVSEVEPAGEIFSENEKHFDALAEAYVAQANAVLNGSASDAVAEGKAKATQLRKHRLVPAMGALSQLASYMHQDFTHSEVAGVVVADANILLQKGRVLRKRKNAQTGTGN